MNILETKAYQKAFIRYLRKGTPIALSLKAEVRPTTHYIWRTAGDGKVRPSHAANEGRIFAWNNPPPTGHPGEDYNCRCTAEPYYGVIINDPPLEPVYPELLLPIGRFARLIANLYRQIRDVDANSMTQAQAKSLERFDKKLPKDAKEIQVIKGSDGQRIFRSDVPARNIPGSFARYEKVVTMEGKTISYTKTTYAPDGRIIHVKDKLGSL